MNDREVKQVIVIRRDLGMRRGKEIAQGAHAAMEWLSARMDFVNGSDVSFDVFTPAERAWMSGTFAKVVLQVNSEEELLKVHENAIAADLNSQLVIDAGRTEFHGKHTITALAIGPDYAEAIDKITGDLKLY